MANRVNDGVELIKTLTGKGRDEQQAIIGLGSLTDFDPYETQDWPQCAGVYVLYDISQRPIYVGKAEKDCT
jgi:hypothetical protein